MNPFPVLGFERVGGCARASLSADCRCGSTTFTRSWCDEGSWLWAKVQIIWRLQSVCRENFREGGDFIINERARVSEGRKAARYRKKSLGVFSKRRGLSRKSSGVLALRCAMIGFWREKGGEKGAKSEGRGAKSVIFSDEKPIGCEVSFLCTLPIRKEILPLPYGRSCPQTRAPVHSP